MPRIGSLRPTPHGGFAGSLHLVDVIVDIALEPRAATSPDRAEPRWDVMDATGEVIGTATLDDHDDLRLAMAMPLLDRREVHCVVHAPNGTDDAAGSAILWLIEGHSEAQGAALR